MNQGLPLAVRALSRREGHPPVKGIAREVTEKDGIVEHKESNILSDFRQLSLIQPQTWGSREIGGRLPNSGFQMDTLRGADEAVNVAPLTGGIFMSSCLVPI